MKKLSEMTLEELWHLFPIELVKQNPNWENYYLEMENYLKSILKNKHIIISHIGSTSIKNIYAKPIIDILIETNDLISTKEILEKQNFITMCKDNNRISMNKGYTPSGFAEKVYHIHLRHFGDNKEIHFKDYLNLNPNIAKEYEKLKLSLSKEYKYNRDKYTEMKSDFINKYTNIAIEYFKEDHK